MTKLHKPELRKGAFAVAAVAIVSMTGAVAFAQTNATQNTNDNGGYDNDFRREKEAQKLNTRIAKANYEYEHTMAHSFWQVARGLGGNDYVAFNDATSDFNAAVDDAQSVFSGEVNVAIATERTDAQFDQKFDAAQAVYLSAINAAGDKLAIDLQAAKINPNNIPQDLLDASDVLSTYLDYSQAKFTQNTGTDEQSNNNGHGRWWGWWNSNNNGYDPNQDSTDKDDHERPKHGKYNGNPEEFKPSRNHNR